MVTDSAPECAECKTGALLLPEGRLNWNYRLIFAWIGDVKL